MKRNKSITLSFEYAEAAAKHMLGTSYAEALAMLDRGELKGTIAEIELTIFREMLNTTGNKNE